MAIADKVLFTHLYRLRFLAMSLNGSDAFRIVTLEDPLLTTRDVLGTPATEVKAENNSAHGA